MMTQPPTENVLKVLITEDDIFTSCVIEQVLRQAGIAALTSSNGQKAIDLINAHNDITHVILDLNMPIINGYGVLDYLNKHAEFANVTVLINSCTSKTEFIENTEKMNINTQKVKAYFEKPYNYETIPKIINNIN